MIAIDVLTLFFSDIADVAVLYGKKKEKKNSRNS